MLSRWHFIFSIDYCGLDRTCGSTTSNIADEAALKVVSSVLLRILESLVNLLVMCLTNRGLWHGFQATLLLRSFFYKFFDNNSLFKAAEILHFCGPHGGANTSVWDRLSLSATALLCGPRGSARGPRRAALWGERPMIGQLEDVKSEISLWVSSDPGKSDKIRSRKLDMRKSPDPGKSDRIQSRIFDMRKSLWVSLDPGKSDRIQSRIFDMRKSLWLSLDPGKSDRKRSRKFGMGKSQ
ncbi:hypothetical protein WH47_00074 [Habropoda laboriosa]|uniref:Uncharacterized protein n=1 Tax=Habropoda laboriosa TaxID=597456 RepID=A0A0L7RK42_9HYME|nr:hypothetical protein WH47_00074 [Habropoda laboriosa]